MSSACEQFLFAGTPDVDDEQLRTPIQSSRAHNGLIFVITLVLLSIPVGILQAQTVTGALPVGGQPKSIAVNPVTNKIYVANYANGTVTVIDGATNSTTTVGVGTAPSAIAVNPATNKVYVASAGNNAVTVIEGATNATASIPTPAGPQALAVNTVTNKIYVANTWGNCVTVIDGATNAANTIGTNGTYPVAIAVDPVTNRVYVANQNSANVTVINGATNSMMFLLPAGPWPSALAVNPAKNRIYVANAGGSFATVLDGRSLSATNVGAGNGSLAVAVNPVTNKAYIVNNGSNSVTVIDGLTNAPTNVGVGSYPTAVAVNTQTNKIYVANMGGTVTVIDGATNATATLSAGITPTAVAVNPITGKYYVANKDSNDVTVIDGTTVSTTTVPTGFNPQTLAINPVTNKIYVPSSNSSFATVVDGTNNSTVNVGIGAGAVAAAVNPATNKIYVANRNSHNVTEIDGATNTTLTIPTGQYPSAIAVNPVTNKVYVANFGQGSLTVIDRSTNATRTVTSSGSGPLAIAVNPQSNRIYVANRDSGSVAVIDGSADNPVTVVSGGSGPVAIAVNPSTNRIYVAGSFSNTLTVINGETNATSTFASGGGTPLAVAVNPVTNRVYVANNSSNAVAVFDGASNSLLSLIGTGGGPRAIAVDTNTNKIYVANNGGNSITVIDGLTNATTVFPAGSMPMAIASNSVTGKVYAANYGNSILTVLAPGAVQDVALTAQVRQVDDGNLVSGLAIAGTTNPYASFTATATSGLGLTPPAPAAVYYKLDSLQPPWTRVERTSSYGTNPADFEIALDGVPLGIHTLYTFATYGNEGTPFGSSQGSGNSPEIGSVSTYSFAVMPIPTTTTVTSDVNPQVAGQSVTLTAYVTPRVTGLLPQTGRVSFSDGAALLGSVVLDPSSHAVLSATLSEGSHTITATYSGDVRYLGSSGNLTQQVALPQTITFDAIPDQVWGDGPLTLKASASSGLPVQYQVTSGPATVSGNVLTFNSAGEVTVEATQPGNAAYAAATPVGLTFNILRRTAFVTPNAASKTYGSADPEFTGTVTGFVAADNISASYGRAAGETVIGGPYIISATLSPAAALANYDITYNTAQFTISPATALVTPNAASKVYGTTDPFLTGTLGGFLESDNVIATYARAAGDNVDGSPYTISATLSPSVVLSNYNITYNTAQFTITPAAASVKPNPATKIYGSADPALTGTLSGFVAGDNVTAAFTRSAGETVASGPYTISATLSPAGALANYNVAYETATFTITPASVSVTPTPSSKTYGGSDPVLTGTLAGFLVADNVTATYSRVAGESVNGGPYSISATLAPAQVLSNYEITYNTSAFTINPATAFVRPSTSSKTYGATDPAFTGTLSGFVAADEVAASYSRSAGETIAGGPYTISATLSPANVLSNYDITYDTAQFTITPATASVTPQTASKIYGSADPVFTGAVTGFVAADNVTAAYTRTPGESVAGSPYTINATLSPTLALVNYNISYNTAAFTITQAPASVKANAATKTYGSADPVLTGSLAGFLPSDSVTATYTRTAGETVAGGPYTISAAVGPAAVLGNYVMTLEDAQLTITPATLNVVVNDKSRAYGETNPMLDGTISGVMFSDAIAASYSTTATPQSEPGTYSITAALADPGNVLGNYTVVNNPGTLTITKAPSNIAIVPSSGSVVFGSSVTLTASISASPGVVATGIVTFRDGQTTLGTASLDSAAKATYSTTSFTPGPHSITAQYSGDTLYSTSTSPATTVTVQDFSLPTTSPSLTVIAGQTQTTNISVTPQHGFTGTVSFTCSVPTNMVQASCSATSAQVGGSEPVNSTLTVTTTGAHRIAANAPQLQWYAVNFGSVFAGMLLVGVPGWKRRRNLILALLVILLFGVLAGCGGGDNNTVRTDPGTPAGTYVLTVAASSGTAAHTMNISVTVQ